jgi:hypothetical protein
MRPPTLTIIPPPFHFCTASYAVSPWPCVQQVQLGQRPEPVGQAKGVWAGCEGAHHRLLQVGMCVLLSNRVVGWGFGGGGNALSL